MHFIRWIQSYLLLLKASAYQGNHQFDKVIQLALKAKALDPRSLMAFLFLGDDYHRLKRYREAKDIVHEALTMYPHDEQLNQLMVQILVDSGESIESAIPYIKTYLTYRTRKKGKFPKWMYVMMKLPGKKVDLDAYGDYLYEQSNSWAQWAQRVLDRYEKKTSGKGNHDTDADISGHGEGSEKAE